MQPYIGRWHCRYRVSPGQPDAVHSVAALERDVRRRVLDSYAALLDDALAGDPTVYVVRRLSAGLSLHTGGMPDDTALARRWGVRIGAELLRSLQAGGGEANVVRFADEPEYIATFISDLLHDTAWQRWYYGAFTRFRHALKKDAVLGILLENPGHLAAIFRALARLGCLGAVLDLLDVDASRALWTEAVAPPARAAEPAEFRIFVRATLEIIEVLGLWAGEPVQEERLLAAYVAAHPPLPDWTDRRSLALAVMHVLRFAQRRRWLVLPPHLAAAGPAPKLADTLARLDWLDTAWLAASIGEWFTQNPTASGMLPARRIRQTATPTQQRLLEHLRRILRARVVTLEFGAPESESNALRLYAALAAAEPELAAHPAARSIIVLLLAAWKLILESGDALEFPGRPIENVFDLPSSPANQTLRAVGALGEPAAELLTALIAQSAGQPAKSREGAIETSCAGLFLLLRAITEVRLPQIIASRNVGPLPAILLGLGIHWAGISAIRGGAPDPGLALWCGLSGPPRPVAETLAQLDVSRCEMLLARILEIVESLAAMHPSLHADEMPGEWRAVLTEGWPAAVQRIPALEAAAAHLLRLWARWLPGIGHSGPPYLLENLIRRSGRIEIHDEFLRVAMAPAPLDTVLEMSAYLGEIPAIPWLGDRRVSLRIVRGGL